MLLAGFRIRRLPRWRRWFAIPAPAAAACLSAAAYSRAAVVINEVSYAPTATESGQWCELYNNGSAGEDLNNWWFCVQPGSQYFRLLRVPPFTSGAPESPSIVLGAGEYLTIRWDQGVNGDYSVAPSPSNPNLIFHRVSADPTVGLAGDMPLPPCGNASLFQFSGIGGNFPNFGTPSAMRDFVLWAPGGAYHGAGTARCATAIAAGLWPPGSGSGADLTCVAVNTATIYVGSGMSIQYNGGATNSPADYYVAPATWLAANASQPFDLDADGDADLADYDAFSDCFIGPSPPADCAAADGNGDQSVNLADFAGFQRAFTGVLGPPPGDFTGDGHFDLADFHFWGGCMAGPRVCPTDLHCLAFDADDDGDADIQDYAVLVRTFGL